MNILVTILLVLAGIIALLLIVALFMRKAYHVQRDVLINVSQQKAFDYLKQLKNQDYFNKWVMADPNMKKEFKGTDGTVGFIYGWNGNKQAGEGEQEITTIEEGKRVESEIRFVRPFAGVAHVDLIIEQEPGKPTRVTWSNESKMKYPLNIMLPIVEPMLQKDMDASLRMLKEILEK